MTMTTTIPTTAGGTIDQALELIDEWIGPTGVAGAGAAVWHRGKIVAERYAGEARPGIPVTAETLFALASVTKPITATVAMTLVERGLVSLDEPVNRLVPEFAAGPDSASEDVDRTLENLRRTVTVRHLLAHTSGLPEDLGRRDSRYADQPSLPVVMEQLARLPLRSAPGTELRYSNAGFAVVARVVEAATGQSFWQAARELLLDRGELSDLVAQPGAHLADRLALVADVSHPGTPLEPYNGDYWRDLAIPWGGMFGTPQAVACFAGSFLSGEPRLLSAAAAALMTEDQAEGVPGGVESAKVRWPVAAWGLGWEVKGHKRRHWTGELTSIRTFCHWGHAGTLVWADPDHDLALAVFGNRTVAHLWPLIPPRWARLSNAVVAAAS